MMGICLAVYRVTLVVVLLAIVCTVGAVPVVVPPWQGEYGGPEAGGPDVIALWQFDKEGQTIPDVSGNGHDLTLRGDSRIVAGGRFGGCLESFPADTENDRDQGAIAAKSPLLTPDGPFSIDLWAKLKPDAAQYPILFLVDKKNYYYASDLSRANRDYCLYLRRRGSGWGMVANLGFGEDSSVFNSASFALDEEWHHLAMTYDGAGTVTFYLDGMQVGRQTEEGRGAVRRGQYRLVVGDRYGSVHKGFPGFLDQVRICRVAKAFYSGELTLRVSEGRRAFRRMESAASLSISVVNDTGKPLRPGELAVSLAQASTTFAVPALAPEEGHRVELSVDTSLRPDRYILEARFAADAEEVGTLRADLSEEVIILPRSLPQRMPVVMWGTGAVETVADIGFTHQIHWMGYFDGAVYNAREPVPEAIGAGRRDAVLSQLDAYMAQGLGAVLKLYPGSWMGRQEKVMEIYQRIDREGQPRARTNVCAAFPDIPDYGYDVGATVMQAFGHMPAVASCMIHSEIRDGTAPCFHDHDREGFREAAGIAIPAEVESKTGVRWQDVADFPQDRVIDPDHPILTYYRWFWKGGDGWPGFNSAIHHGVKSTGRSDVWTYHDPAVRVPSLWGSGGEVDVLNQWTYTYPDPIKIGQACDELFAMADGRPGQQVMKMTQVIWKRFQTTSASTPADELADWEKEQPDAKYYTIAPDHLREAFWSKISRPVRGIMYHGWGSLVPPTGKPGGYRFTHPGTGPTLQALIRDVIRPLGPTLLQVPDPPADVAILESFTSQMFAGRGTYGWSNGWEADAHLILQWAHLQPSVVYEETILRDRLTGYKVLVMPYCDVLTTPVVAAIHAFQDSGGIVVTDEHVTPAILPDILLPAYRRTGQAEQDKAALQRRAAALRRELDTVYDHAFDATSPDLVLRQRRYAGTDYLFAINDRRTYGDYVGQHGFVMEKGLPLSAEIMLPREAEAVYDLVARREVPFRRTDAGIAIGCESGPAQGHVYMVCARAIGGVSIEVPERIGHAGRGEITVTVVDSALDPMRAVVPVQLEVLDPDGRPGEFSGFYGVRDGRVTVSLDLAENDRTGLWRLRATELASGRTGEATLYHAAPGGG